MAPFSFMRRPVQWNYAAGARVARRVGKTNLPYSIAYERYGGLTIVK